MVTAASGTLFDTARFAATSSPNCVLGDSEGQFGNGATAEAYLTFDMRSIPPGHVSESAVLSWGPSGPSDYCTENAFSSLGSVVIESMLYDSTLEWADHELLGLYSPATFATNWSQLQNPKNVSAWFYGDLASRILQSNLTQYRLKFTNPANNNGVNDNCSLTKSSFKLVVETRAP